MVTAEVNSFLKQLNMFGLRSCVFLRLESLLLISHKQSLKIVSHIRDFYTLNNII